MDIHLVDGTYELFRFYHAVPSAKDADGREVAAVRAVVGSILGMITGGATHVADAADGYPGLPGWGAKSTAAVLAKFGHIESIPPSAADWHVNATSAPTLARTLVEQRENALLYRTLATLRTDISLFASVDELEWKGPTSAFAKLAARIDAPGPPR